MGCGFRRDESSLHFQGDTLTKSGKNYHTEKRSNCFPLSEKFERYLKSYLEGQGIDITNLFGENKANISTNIVNQENVVNNANTSLPNTVYS